MHWEECLCIRRKQKSEKYYQQKVLAYLFGSETKQSFKIPLRRLHFNSYTDFIAAIPFHMVQPYISSQIAPNTQQEFKKNDRIVWKSTARNVTESATFLKYSSSNTDNSHAKIRLERKIAFLRSETINVRIGEVIHYKDYLKQFLPSPPQSSRVTVVESYQERSVDLPKVDTGTHPYLTKMEDNLPTNIAEGYGKGKLVYNKSTKAYARISDTNWVENNGSFERPVVSYCTVSVTDNGIKDDYPFHGGQTPLAAFMNDWEPTTPEQLMRSRMVNAGENMETDEIPSKEVNIPSSSISKANSNDDYSAISGEIEQESRESKRVGRKASGKTKLIRKHTREENYTAPYAKSHRYDLRKNKADVLSENKEEKDIKRTKTSKYRSLSEANDSAVLPSTSSGTKSRKKGSHSNSGVPQEVVTTNRKNSQDSLQNSTEILKSGERFHSTRNSENPEEQTVNIPDDSKINSIPYQINNVTIQDNEQTEHSPSNDERYICGNSGKIAPKIRNPQEIPLANTNQKLAHIQAQNNLFQLESISTHRNNTSPGITYGSKIPNQVTTEIIPTFIERKAYYVEEVPSSSTIPPPHTLDNKSSVSKPKKESTNPEKVQILHSGPPAKFDRKHAESIIPRNLTHIEINRFCGRNKGIQGRNNSCYLDATIFSLYYCSNIFDKITLESKENDDEMAKEVKRILRDRIVRPLRLDNICSAENVRELRCVMAPLSSKINGSFMDAEELMFLLFENALKLKEFIKYSCETEDFMHQIVPNPADREKCQSVQILLQNSLKYLGDMKFADIPNPALILEMPRSNGKLVHYEAIIPTLSLDLSSIMKNDIQQDRKYCMCNNEPKWECRTCEISNGKDATAYCSSCKEDASTIHETTDHSPDLVEIRRKSSMDLMAVICIRASHYVTFVRCGVDTNSPWLFFDSMAGAYPEVEEVKGMGKILEALEKQPEVYNMAINSNHFTRRILTESHICIYHSSTINSTE